MASHAARALALATCAWAVAASAADAPIAVGTAPPDAFQAPTWPEPEDRDGGWEAEGSGVDGGWLATFLAEAGLHEEVFNLPAAMHRYRQGCEIDPPPGAGEAWWNDRLAACEGYVDAAFALEDWAGLDKALNALIAARPARPFTPSRFPPLVIARAAELARAMPTGTLEIDGPPVPVELDGRAVGVPPLRLTGVPAGRRHLRCGGHSRAVELAERGSTALRCPGPDTLGSVEQLPDALDGPPAWLVIDEGAEGIEPGIWVFQGGARAVGLLVTPQNGDGEQEPRRWLDALARARTR